MEVSRCKWVENQPAIYIEYHDRQWGVPVHDDRLLFQKLVLDGAQAGLSWLTILKKREEYIRAFDGFDIEKVASYGEDKVVELMNNPGIVRNRLKILSAIKNARAVIGIQNQFGSFDKFLWGFTDGRTIHGNFRDIKEVPASSPLSDTISKEMKRRGMSFTGTTIIYAYLQAIGILNDHTTDCFRYHELLED
ncbi:MAG TPA: DNA-3-methyladenine glycosylase I [Clostridia bacterium]|nr:DNA-3-methyladenine glycosylase I [Clostridia bacterium]